MARPVSIVTGASRGVGLETARGLIAAGHHVVLAVRDLARGEASVREIGGGEAMLLDIADLESVRAFATAFHARHDRLDVLVNNAGIHRSRLALSPQGIEMTYATNHVGHFLLTHLLLERLRATPGSRIVNVASEAHRAARTIREEDLTGAGKWSGIQAYSGSKLANIQFTLALARRLKDTDIRVNAVHPGSVRTGWARGRESGPLRFVVALASPFMLSPKQGAESSLHAALTPDAHSGRYYQRRGETTPSRIARDIDAQEDLWRWTAALTGTG